MPQFEWTDICDNSREVAVWPCADPPCGRGLNFWGFVTVCSHHINNPGKLLLDVLAVLCFAEDVGRIATT